MTIQTGVCKEFLAELALGMHDVEDDTIKVALYGPNANLSVETDFYTTDGEVSGGGYSAGGATVPLLVVGSAGSALNGGTQFTHPYVQPTEDTSITAASVGVRGFMIYNSSKSNRAMFVGDFGETISPASGITFSWDVANVTQFQQVLIPLIGLGI